MIFFKTLSLFLFGFGIATLVKGYGITTLFESNPWLGLPMVVIGVVGITLLFGED